MGVLEKIKRRKHGTSMNYFFTVFHKHIIISHNLKVLNCCQISCLGNKNRIFAAGTFPPIKTPLRGLTISLKIIGHNLLSYEE